MKIYVTGMGVVSCIGNNVEQNFNALMNRSSGISEYKDFPGARKSFLAGKVKLSNKELEQITGVHADTELHRSTLLGLLAAQEAWANRQEIDSRRTGIVYGTTIGSVELTEQILGPNISSALDLKLDYNKCHDHRFGADFIASEFGIQHNKFTISTACSTGANAILLGARMIQSGVADRVLVGSAESLTNYTLNGFDSLNLYDSEVCRPFDNERNGLNLGEAAGFLVLETEALAKETNARIVAEIKGWGNACDAYHQTATSPEGKGAAMSIIAALEMAGLSRQEIDYINAHGTGTPNNDLSECHAMMQVFGDQVPEFSSTKGFTGHTLSASGSIEAIYAILSLQHGKVIQNSKLKVPMNDVLIRPVTSTQQTKTLKYALSSSFGFGGNCTSLIFSTP